MSAAPLVHLLVPAGYADPLRPSGGNTYDRQVATGLAELGWAVVVHEVAGAWPSPDPAVAATVDRELGLVAAGGLIVVDGLLGQVAASALVRHAARLRLVALVHMPGPPGGPPRGVLRAARLVITTSRSTASSLQQADHLAAGSLLVAPPGVALAERAPGTATGGTLLCVAAVSVLKGHDVLFAALAGLARMPWTCVCAGALDRDPAFVDRQRRALADHGIADRVSFAGPLGGADLDGAYAAADVLVLASRQESYGMVVTEALARGLPVIATDVGGVGEALGHAADGRRPGLLVAPDDARALGAAIAGWLGDPHLRHELRSAASSRRATLTGWHQTVLTISTALHRLMVT